MIKINYFQRYHMELAILIITLGVNILHARFILLFFNLLICNFRINFSTLNEIVNGMELAKIIFLLGVKCFIMARFILLKLFIFKGIVWNSQFQSSPWV